MNGARNPRLIGVSIIPHLTSDDARHITTSPIVKVEGRMITTRSGSLYLLEGPPHQFFRNFLTRNQLPYYDKRPLDCLLGDFIRIDRTTTNQRN